ncbi:MAG: hypothetical protein LCH63_15310 [Candidatus Melainabacteria bacterium]|jgi:L-lactate permease|uniref:Uncharacterized protein n=1 Tax=Candidatus Obscuribacter phosphatis TaxID=1906157 RepID=A0A8J7P9T3_9BACT|nr:hypothetical protein [Candidatus Obscuribacter phosphatis]MBX9942387.1 hypothetical protein [Candidatus Obscuribacterales bacterium]MCA0315182.1 hypothetical protein [Candidatus Melainabacteria bacterium]
MKTWILKVWNNKFVRDRILAIIFLILMFANFTAAYHGTTDGEKLPGLVGGMISLLVILAFVFDDYDPDDEDPNKNPDRYKGRLR